MWTNENRAHYDRSGLRYPSDVTDAEWELVSPLIPPARRGGGKRKVNMREVVNGLMYVLSTGCQWRAIPKDLPPKSTVYGYFDLWTYDGTVDRLHHALYVKCHEAAGREGSPTAAVIDSQSVQAAETYGPPRLQVGSFIRSEQSAQTYPAFQRRCWPRWRFARPDPHKGVGVERHFPPRVSGRRSIVRPSFFHHPQTSRIGARLRRSIQVAAVMAADWNVFS